MKGFELFYFAEVYSAEYLIIKCLNKDYILTSKIIEFYFTINCNLIFNFYLCTSLNKGN